MQKKISSAFKFGVSEDKIRVCVCVYMWLAIVLYSSG